LSILPIFAIAKSDSSNRLQFDFAIAAIETNTNQGLDGDKYHDTFASSTIGKTDKRRKLTSTTKVS